MLVYFVLVFSSLTKICLGRLVRTQKGVEAKTGVPYPVVEVLTLHYCSLHSSIGVILKTSKPLYHTKHGQYHDFDQICLGRLVRTQKGA
jgi:hypothetical protein